MTALTQSADPLETLYVPTGAGDGLGAKVGPTGAGLLMTVVPFL